MFIKNECVTDDVTDKKIARCTDNNGYNLYLFYVTDKSYKRYIRMYVYIEKNVFQFIRHRVKNNG